MKGQRIWILGAADPEMSAIELLLGECGEHVVYAACAGKRVHPGNAYLSDMPEAWRCQVYLVECDVARTGHLRRGPGVEPPSGVDSADERPVLARVIDHHRPGDPGFGCPPAEFLAASSIGQVVRELARLGGLPTDWDRLRGGECYEDCDEDGYSGTLGGVQISYADDFGWSVSSYDDLCQASELVLIPADIIQTAAADHCLGAAYLGRCPGVRPDELMRWRAESRAAYQQRPIEAVLADIHAAMDVVRAAPLLQLRLLPPCADSLADGEPCAYCGEWYSPAASAAHERCGHVTRSETCVRDMRTAEPQADARGSAVPELPEAALRLGEGYIAGPLLTPDGRSKIVCSGTTDQVRAFLEHWAPHQGLVDSYGDPERGFAGAYLP